MNSSVTIDYWSEVLKIRQSFESINETMDLIEEDLTKLEPIHQSTLPKIPVEILKQFRCRCGVKIPVFNRSPTDVYDPNIKHNRIHRFAMNIEV